jgi:hypothetical protein
MTIMKQRILYFANLILCTLFLSAHVTALSPSTNISLNHAYAKGNGNYDVVLKGDPGSKLGLYVNDKNPVFATVNKKDWATFHKVKVVDKGKLSFTRVYTTKGKSVQKPINYVRFTSIGSDTNVGFSESNPSQSLKTTVTPATPVTTPEQSMTTPPASTVVTPAPQPTCTNGTYVNSAGSTVCSPETASSAPAGATAKCVDGTYSFSQSHSGTCSHHGGVAQWL